MKILSMGDRVRPGNYAVKARFARSVLLLDGADRALFVVDRSIGAGPLNLVVADPSAFVSGDSLAIASPRRDRRGLQRRSEWSRHDPVPVSSGPRFDSALPRLDAAAQAKLLRMLASALPRHAPPESLVSLFFPTKRLPRLQANRDALFWKAFDQFAAGRLAAGVRLIRGCGEGLTPSGDDFLCGWMLALRLRGSVSPIPAILKSALGRNPVSNAFLELSAQGRVNVAVKRLLQAPSAARVKAVCAFGHSSGADLLCGMCWGLGREVRGWEGSS